MASIAATFTKVWTGICGKGDHVRACGREVKGHDESAVSRAAMIIAATALAFGPRGLEDCQDTKRCILVEWTVGWEGKTGTNHPALCSVYEDKPQSMTPQYG